MTAPDTVFFAHGHRRSAPTCEIEPHVVFGPGVTIENGATYPRLLSS